MGANAEQKRRPTLNYEKVSKVIGKGVRKWMREHPDNTHTELTQMVRVSGLPGASGSTITRLKDPESAIIPNPQCWETLHHIIPEYVPAPDAL